jgi:hypothetical protein
MRIIFMQATCLTIPVLCPFRWDRPRISIDVASCELQSNADLWSLSKSIDELILAGIKFTI